MLLGAVLGGVPAASAQVRFVRDDIAVPSPPVSVALGDLDGVHGKDIVIALWQPGKVGVMLDHGDGTFGPLQQYSAGPECVGQAVEIELGDVTSPAGKFVQDGKLDVYVACTPYVVRLTGDGTGALGSPMAFQLYLPPYLGPPTIDFLTLVRRPDGNPAPLLALQHAVGSFGRELCFSYELDSEALVCSPTPVQGPLAVGDLNGAFPGVPPDEIVTSVGADKIGIFGFAHQLPTYFTNSVRTVPGGRVGCPRRPQPRRSPRRARRPVREQPQRPGGVDPLLPHGCERLEQVARTLPSTPGLDAVAIADVDKDGCADVVGAGGYGRGMIHLGDGASGFDGGTDLPQLGYQNPATSTRMTLAVGDLTGDGRPELVIADQLGYAVMVYRNTSTAAGGPCFVAPPPPTGRTGSGDNEPARHRADAGADPTPPPAVPRTCTQPGTTRYTVGTPRDDVLVGGVGRDVLSGRGGDDCLFGFTGDDLLTGGTGKDLLVGASGDDRIKADAGDDKINAGNGNDDITPGPGNDIANGQGGDDTISARDGARDTIDCGAGRDKVTADRTDAVKNCEFVKRAKRHG